MRSYPRNPYDVRTLDDLLQQAETIISMSVKTVAVDLCYRGRHVTQAQVIHRGGKLSTREKERLRRRSALKAIIGHMKVDGLLERCHLKDLHGDAAHAILCGIGHNLPQLRAWWIRRLFALWVRWLGQLKLPHSLQNTAFAA